MGTKYRNSLKRREKQLVEKLGSMTVPNMAITLLITVILSLAAQLLSVITLFQFVCDPQQFWDQHNSMLVKHLSLSQKHSL